MFCTIREIKTKKTRQGKNKSIEVYTSSFSGFNNGVTKYGYTYSSERFTRPPKPSYEISIQHSYRKNGKVNKKRWKIATINYYDFVDGWANWYEHINDSEWDSLLEEMGLSFDELEQMINDKLAPIVERIEAEYRQTEEYKTHIEHERITTIYFASKTQFEDQWVKETYDYIYDVFGELRNPEHLEYVKREKVRSEEYQCRSEQAQRERFKDWGSFFNHSSLGTSEPVSAENSKHYKSFYRTLAKEFHPDKGKDPTGEAMKLINALKEQRGV